MVDKTFNLTQGVNYRTGIQAFHDFITNARIDPSLVLPISIIENPLNFEIAVSEVQIDQDIKFSDHYELGHYLKTQFGAHLYSNLMAGVGL